MGACVSVSAIRPHAFFVLVFLIFDNLMLEFFQKKRLIGGGDAVVERGGEKVQLLVFVVGILGRGGVGIR